MDVAVLVALLVLVAVTALGAVDTRDGRDWQPRPDSPARHRGD